MLPTKHIVLAEKMATQLELMKLSPTDYKWALFVLDKLLGKMQRSKYGTGDVEMPATYIAKAFKSKGQKMLRQLVRAGIVVSPQSWSTGDFCEAFCRSYRINEDLCEFDQSAQLAVSVDPDQKESLASRVLYMEDNLRQLDVDVTKALQVAHRLANNITLDKYDVNEEIEGDFLRVRMANKNTTWRWSKEKALAKAQEWGMTLIRKRKKHGKKVATYVKDPLAYVASVRAISRMSWTKAILDLDMGVIRAARNVTNRRLDSNISNLPTCVLEHVSTNCGESLLSIDLSNSQFAFLAAIMRNGDAFADKRAVFFKGYELTESSEQFLASAEAGTLYEDCCVAWGLDPIKDRGVAKIGLFACLFSQVKTSSVEKEKLRAIYPQVVEMIDAFKRKHGFKQFAVLLQLCESEVFIDGASAELDWHEVWHLTKHDSILGTASDCDFINTTVQKHLAKYGVQGQLKAAAPAHIN